MRRRQGDRVAAALAGSLRLARTNPLDPWAQADRWWGWHRSTNHEGRHTDDHKNEKPIDTIRDGSLKATIWKNTRENGDFYSVPCTRTWKDDQGAYCDSDSFRGSELLRIARLANIAYSEIAIHRAKDRTAHREQTA